jgi:hypothetical protein
MKFLEKALSWAMGKSVMSDFPIAVRSPSNLLLDMKSEKTKRAAINSLVEQLHEVVNKNADGVNLAAINIRRESDLLLTLGITDALVAKAGTLAQAALEMANAGRGVDINEEKHEVAVADRVEGVAAAMAIVTKAEGLLLEAKKSNKKNIDAALTRQATLLEEARAIAYTLNASPNIQ